jgi:hypothetical protein
MVGKSYPFDKGAISHGRLIKCEGASRISAEALGGCSEELVWKIRVDFEVWVLNYFRVGLSGVRRCRMIGMVFVTSL